jgi:ArsR family transcriptional regulator
MPELAAHELRAISRVLSDLRRFAILKHIARQPSTACADLRRAFPSEAATLSHHLRELESAGLIEIARRGKFADLVFRRTTWQAYVSALQSI